MTRFHVGIWLCRNREKCHSAYAIFHHVEIPGRNGISSHGSFNRYPHDCQRPCISWRMTHLRRRRSIGGLQIVKPLEPRATRRSRVCARCESGQEPSGPIAGTRSPSHRRGSLRRQGPDRMPRRGLINVTRLSQLNSTGFNFVNREDDLNGTCIKWGCRPLRHGKLRGGVPDAHGTKDQTQIALGIGALLGEARRHGSSRCRDGTRFPQRAVRA